MVPPVSGEGGGQREVGDVNEHSNSILFPTRSPQMDVLCCYKEIQQGRGQ